MIEARLQHRAGDFSLDVDLQLPLRGISAVFGPSGAGKTTLLRCVAGLEPRARGTLRVGDQCWMDSARGLFVPVAGRGVGYVMQDPGLFEHLDVGGNLDFGQRRTPAPQRRTDLAQVTGPLGLDSLRRRPVAGLSGGERQRVALARALLAAPRLLLLDEPLAALDQGAREGMLPMLGQLGDALSVPMLYVGHDLAEVARLASHLVLLQDGRVLACAPAGEVFTRLDLPLAHREDAAALVQATVVEQLGPAGITRLRFGGGELLVPAMDCPVGTPARVRIQARDVSVCRAEPVSSSILNRLPVRIRAIAADRSSPHVTLSLAAGTETLLCRITRHSRDTLALAEGDGVWAQFKALAVESHGAAGERP